MFKAIIYIDHTFGGHFMRKKGTFGGHFFKGKICTVHLRFNLSLLLEIYKLKQFNMNVWKLYSHFQLDILGNKSFTPLTHEINELFSTQQFQ